MSLFLCPRALRENMREHREAGALEVAADAPLETLEDAQEMVGEVALIRMEIEVDEEVMGAREADVLRVAHREIHVDVMRDAREVHAMEAENILGDADRGV